MAFMGIAAVEATIATERTSRGMPIRLQGRVSMSGHDASVELRGHPAEFYLWSQPIDSVQIDNQYSRNWNLIARI